jgi:Plasmid recombination enzyme
MSYVVLRIAKLKTSANIGGLNAHLTRTMDVPNADPELQKYNTRPIGTEDLNQDIDNRIKALRITPRKNAVLAVEHLMTSGAEAFNFQKKADGQLYGDNNKWNAFEQNAHRWLTERYGKENLVNFTVHKDENAPHIHAVIVPVVGDKLNCRAILGDRGKLREMQSSIAEVMKPLGLERGIEGSKATHVALKEFYGNLQKGEILAAETRKVINEAPKIILEPVPVMGHKKWKEQQEAAINERINEVIGKYEPIVKISVQVQAENKQLKEQIRRMSKENVQLKKENQKALLDIRKVLTEDKIFPGMKEAYIPDVLKKQQAAQELKTTAGQKWGMGR